MNEQEWTPEWFEMCHRDHGGFAAIATAINAALAAEGDKWRKALTAASDLAKQTFAEKDKQLAAEREKWKSGAEGAIMALREHHSEQLAAEREYISALKDDLTANLKHYETLRQQLLAVLAAIAEHNDKVNRGDPITVDLSALDKHDAEVYERGYREGGLQCAASSKQHDARKPLVEALVEIKRLLEWLKDAENIGYFTIKISDIVDDALAAKAKEGNEPKQPDYDEIMQRNFDRQE